MNRYEIKRQKKAYQKLLTEKIKPNFLLTFNFNYEVPPKHGENKMRHFFNVIQDEAFGPNWARQNDREWPTAVGFWERDEKYKMHDAGNPHWHVLAKLDEHLGLVMKREGPSVWRSIIPGGSLDVQKIEVGKWHPIRYSTKGIWKEEALENVFTYCDTRAKPLTEEDFKHMLLKLRAELLDELACGTLREKG